MSAFENRTSPARFGPWTTFKSFPRMSFSAFTRSSTVMLRPVPTLYTFPETLSAGASAAFVSAWTALAT